MHKLKDDSPPGEWGGADKVFAWTFYPENQTGTSSSELFIEAAFKHFGLLSSEGLSEKNKGRELANEMREKRVLLILDSLEWLQNPPGQHKYLTDQSLGDETISSLFEGLRSGHGGLCIITSRLSLPDLRVGSVKNCREIRLEQLDEKSGAKFLRHLLAPAESSSNQQELVSSTPEKTLKQASREYGGHALALRLLGTYLAVAYGGDIRCRDRVGPIMEDTAPSEIEGFEDLDAAVHANRVISQYEGWFEKQKEPRLELCLLQLISLFDRPAESSAIVALRVNPDITGLTATDTRIIRETDWNRAVSNLRKAGLLTNTKTTSNEIDCHKLVREYFSRKLFKSNEKAWKAGHLELSEYFSKDIPDVLPTTLEEIEPLFRAVSHACKAEDYRKAYDIYEKYIRRNDEVHHIRELGAINLNLVILAGFFDLDWNEVKDISKSLHKKERYRLLSDLGTCLLFSGRMEEAKKPLQRALELARKSTRISGCCNHRMEPELAFLTFHLD